MATPETPTPEVKKKHPLRNPKVAGGVLAGSLALSVLLTSSEIGHENKQDETAFKNLPPDTKQLIENLQASAEALTNNFSALPKEQQDAISHQIFKAYSPEELQKHFAEIEALLHPQADTPDVKTFTTNPPTATFAEKFASTNATSEIKR